MAQSRGRRAQHRSLTANPMRSREEFTANLRHMMRRFVLGQSELLLTARHLDEHESTLNSGAARIREAICRTFPDLSDLDVQQAVDLLSPLIRDAQTPRPDDEAEQEARNKDFQTRLTTIAAELDKSLPPGHAFGCIDAAIQTIDASDRLSRVSASLLISLVAEFEVLVSNLFGELFRCFPDWAISTEKSFGWEFISTADTLDGLKDQIIEDAVLATMYSSYGTWLDKFEGFQIAVPSVAREPETKEIFQRRHVVVHNGGRVNVTYLKRSNADPAPVLDSLLEVSLEYLNEAADRLFAVAAGLYAEVVRKVVESGDYRRVLEGLLSKFVYELLSHRRFDALVITVAAIRIDSLDDAYLREMFKVNRWLALKRLGRFEECKDEVEAWDVDSEQPQLVLAKLALLDRTDDGLRLIGEIRGTKSLSIESWATWPLLEDLRRAESSRTLAMGAVQNTLEGVDEMLDGGLS